MIFLALGSNLDSSFGNRFQNIDLAISFLESYGIKIINKSSFYETPSYPNKLDPMFINAVIEIKTTLPPVDLASVNIFIEKKLERIRSKKNQPRTCDIDIIDYKSQLINFKYMEFEFFVPHKKISSRNFVLFPLREISPKWIHPETKDSIDNLINKLSDEDKNSILKIEKS